MTNYLLHQPLFNLPQEETAKQAGNVVEMSWDPITRIVGSLGIYTKLVATMRTSHRSLRAFSLSCA